LLSILTITSLKPTSIALIINRVSSDRRKQEIEGKAFEQFCRLLPFNIQWRHGVRHGDEPDIVAAVAGQRIGMEVTGLTDEDFQRSAVTNHRFTEAVQAGCLSRGLPSVHVSLHGIRSEALNRRNTPAAAKRIWIS
jgi:hypothetical protein